MLIIELHTGGMNIPPTQVRNSFVYQIVTYNPDLFNMHIVTTSLCIAVWMSTLNARASR